jgi:sodium/potassium-transporting ATPase subunit alpha
LVVLSYGTKVPADVRLIESHDLKFDRSMLTGESEAIEGTVECTDERYVESKNIAYMTTLITNGQGKGIVIETGDKTLMGSIAGLTSKAEEKESTLQVELRRFVFIVATAAVIMAITVVIVWAVWLRVQYPDFMDVSSLLVNTISVMVAFIPEGLPVCVTLALLLIAKRMAKSRVLVKDLATIETLSCVNVIASDKTGTLTQNKMFVSSAAIGVQNVSLKTLQKESERTVGFNQLVACSNLCNNAHFEIETYKTNSINNRKANGDATDIALLRFSTEYSQYENFNEYYQILADIPFNSKNKWMMKIIRPENTVVHNSIFKENTADDLMLLKGAPDYLLKKCRSIIDENGDEKLINRFVLIRIYNFMKIS